MHPTTRQIYFFGTVAGLVAAVTLVLLKAVDVWLGLGMLLGTLFFLQDAVAWRRLDLAHRSHDSLLHFLDAVKVVSALLSIGLYIGSHWEPTFLNGGLLTFTAYVFSYALFWYQIRRRDQMLLGDICRGWQIQKPKNIIAFEFFLVLLLVVPVDLTFYLINIMDTLPQAQTEIVFAVLWFMATVLYAVIGPTLSLLIGHESPGANCFISYSRNDSDFAARLTESLELRGVRCFQDVANLRGGDEFGVVIGKAIANSDYFVPVLSNSSIQSPWVEDETKIALHHNAIQGSPTVVPIRICDQKLLADWSTEGNDMGTRLRALNIVNFDEATKSLEESVSALIADFQSR